MQLTAFCWSVKWEKKFPNIFQEASCLHYFSTECKDAPSSLFCCWLSLGDGRVSNLAWIWQVSQWLSGQRSVLRSEWIKGQTEVKGGGVEVDLPEQGHTSRCRTIYREASGSWQCRSAALFLQAKILGDIGTGYCDRCYRSVVCPSVRLSVCLWHSCTLLKTLDGMRCHWQGHLCSFK